MPDRPLIFVHVPKTGGTSLWSALRHGVGQRAVLRIEMADTTANIARLNEMLVTSEAERYRLIGGHVLFDPALAAGYPYMTMLREPVDRAISAYYHVVRVPTHRLHKTFHEEKVGLAEGLARITSNLHTRYLAGVPLDREPNEDDLDAARRYLCEDIPGLGILEYFEESLMLLRQQFGWSLPYYRRHNVGGNRPPTTDPAVREVAAAYNTLDLALYAHARALFEERLARQGIAFKATLWFFRSTLPVWQRRQR